MSRMLKVPYIKQFNDSTCYPACAAMVLKFNGIIVDQRKIYAGAKIPKWPGIWDAPLALTLRNHGVILEIWSDAKKGVVRSRSYNAIYETLKRKTRSAKKLGALKVHKGANIGIIKRMIRDGIPVMAEVQAKAWYGKRYRYYSALTDEDTHMVVIRGFNGQRLIVNDPYVRKRKDVSISQFMKAWTSPLYYKNCISIIYKA